MPWTIPDQGEGDNDIQSILFQEQLDILVAGISGTDCVVSGLAPTAQGSPDMTVAIAKGSVLSNGELFAVAAANATITTANATHPRLDLIVITSAGAIAVRAGTAAAAPKPPARTANDVAIAMVYVPANDTTIGTSQITDMRVFAGPRPVVLKKVTTPVVTNTNNSIFTQFTLTVPNGLFTTGKIIRVRMGGNLLANSGTPTWTLTISYGGSSMFIDTTTGYSGDTDRRPWSLELDLITQANNDQSIVGRWMSGQTTTKTAANTGIGELAAPSASSGVQAANAFSGAAAVDSDAANRDLLVRFTMSVSNGSVETVMEYATAELL